MSAVLDPLAWLNIGRVAKAAKIMSGMSEADILKLGGQVKAVLDKIDSIGSRTRCAI